MTQLNVTRRQSVQLETANQLLHKRNEVLAVEKQDGEINPALYFDSDDERLALLAKQVIYNQMNHDSDNFFGVESPIFDWLCRAKAYLKFLIFRFTEESPKLEKPPPKFSVGSISRVDLLKELGGGQLH